MDVSLRENQALEQCRPIQRIAVFNFAGNSGSRTVARLVVGPVFPDARLIELETFGDPVAVLAAIDDAASRLSAADADVVLTITANTESELKGAVQRLAGDVDMWLIPCSLGSASFGLPGAMNSVDPVSGTVDAIEWLVGIGCDPKSIFVLRNKCRPDDTLGGLDAVQASASRLRVRVVEASIPELPQIDIANDLWMLLPGLPVTLDHVAADKTDYRAQALALAGRRNAKARQAVLSNEFRRKNARYAVSEFNDARFELFGATWLLR